MTQNLPDMTADAYRLGFDVGGTFTDFALVSEADGTMRLGKCLTTPDDPTRGITDGLLSLLADTGVSAGNLSVAIHATTLITNALIERKGAITALIATEGFRDTLEMGTEVRYDNYELSLEMPAPLVPRQRRFGVPERISAKGEVLVALDVERLREIARELLALKVEAVAIVFLHSFINPAHEIEAERILREELPGVQISRSSVVAPEIREFERSSTTAANAYVQPIVRRYIDKTEGMLCDSGFGRRMQMMVSSGGIAGAELVKSQPIRMLESGPAAGVLAAIHFSKLLGLPDLVTFDMGGTTAKLGLVKGHRARKANQFEFGRVSRQMRGSGLPVKVPIIDLIEIGAGGGSIASPDKMGLVQVGPESAGSAPGPACYGLGGKQPTVTDANLLLGYLNPNYFLGGQIQLSRASSNQALARLGESMAMSARELARGIFRIVNQNMTAACKVHIAEQGEDPQKFFLFAFGGAGPIHAWELARQLGMKGVIVPPAAGAGSALGLVVSPVSFDCSRSLPRRLDRLTWEDVDQVLSQMLEEARSVLRETGLPPEQIAAADIIYEMDLRHFGQGRELTVGIPREVIEARVIDGIASAFYAAHQARYGHVHRDLVPELITCRLSISIHAAAVEAAHPAEAGAAPGTIALLPEAKSTREVYFPEIDGTCLTKVYERSSLTPGLRFAGPAIIEERECTIVAGPSAVIEVHPTLALFITPTGAGAD
ncbi:hydantoinase/oxoprolinase family protein [Hoeflea alexandrii]|uniref:hydantoinase/oxoprolinase family protein n=1 Tax=Hoeflea alexandrii TaxID=288436 RepID=UPI0022AEAA47|nr:hydantoinase/oxoprolinase family protein [Hoeflea alexandrii]